MKKMYLITVVIIILVVLFLVNRKEKYTKIVGYAEGTTYSITYNGKNNYKTEIDRLINSFENSLSVYRESSIISKVNRNEEVELDSFFIGCFKLSKYVYQKTNGAFDISASPLFSAWGFGKEKRNLQLDERIIDSLKQFCGMDKVDIIDGKIVKKDKRVQLNCNAVAKGYSVDIVSKFLENKGIHNYLVEIGGEISCKGVNKKRKPWSIGIDKPIDGNVTPGANLQAKIRLQNKALATSGNYRRFFMENGEKYSHTINPATGFPTKHNLLSATVVANTCGEADAFATALMVVGLDSAKQILKSNADLDAFLVYSDKEEFRTFTTPNFEQMMLDAK